MKKAMLLVIIGVALVFFLSRGGFAALGGTMRFLLPAVGIYLAYKYVRKLMLPDSEKSPRKTVDKTPTDDNVIEICPECGHEKKAGHQCERA